MKQVGAVKMLDYFAELTWQCCQVKQEVLAQRSLAKRGQHALEPLIGRTVRQVALAVKNVLPKIPPYLVVHWLCPRILVERLAQFRSPGFVCLFPARHAYHPEACRHLLVLEHMVQRRDQFARCEITAGAKDDDGTGICHPAPFPESGRRQAIRVFLK